MTTTHTKADLSPVEARQQLETAQVHLEDLTNRLSRGDFSVRQGDLVEAQSRVSYLQVVVEGAETADQRRNLHDRTHHVAWLRASFAASRSAEQEDVTSAENIHEAVHARFESFQRSV